ncbi:MAG TPA: methyltransferase domain-containing protein [Epsilonproteobacteria bacterium]|nr:methyltransferase domain-containing protein [Campylobacterota bacterium]
MATEDKIRWDQKYRSRLPSDQPVELIVQYAKLSPGKCALDIACGMGRNSRYLASLGFEVDALDISDVAIESLRNTPSIDPKVVDFDHDTLPKKQYDLVICTYFLERKLFAPITHALTEGGIFLFETFLYHPANEKAPSNPAFLLAQGELQSAFERDYEIIHLREYWDRDPHGNKTMKAALVARKRIDQEQKSEKN